MLARTWSTWDPEHSRRGLKVEQLLESSAELPQRLNSELPQGEAATSGYKPRRAEGRRCTRPVLTAAASQQPKVDTAQRPSAGEGQTQRGPSAQWTLFTPEQG